MTETPGQPTEQSAFNARADNAALKVKEQLSQQLSAMTGEQVVLPPTPVAVGADGQPAGPLPPDGSYARSAIEEQQQLAAQRAHMQAQAQGLDPAAAGPPPGQGQAPPPQEPQEQITTRAQERIQSLVDQLRTKDTEFSTLQQQQSSQATTVEELRSELTASRNQMQSLLDEHMDTLDPETRQQVLSDTRIRQAVADSEKRILGAVAPQLQALHTRNNQLEKVRVSGMYPGYDPVVHDGLIDEFRRGNPNCSIEQAFRAVATPEELSGISGAGRVHAPPPSVPPGNGALNPRYLPNQAQQTDPLTEMREDANKAAELARSADPNDQKAATALWHKNLSDRLGLSVPGT